MIFINKKLPSLYLIFGVIFAAIIGFVITFYIFTHQIEKLLDTNPSIQNDSIQSIDSSLVFPAYSIPVKDNINRIELEAKEGFLNQHPKLFIWIILISALVGLSWAFLLLFSGMLLSLFRNYVHFSKNEILGLIAIVVLSGVTLWFIDSDSVNGQLILVFDDVLEKLFLFFKNPRFVISWVVNNPMLTAFVAISNVIVILVIIYKIGQEWLENQDLTSSETILSQLHSLKQTFDFHITILGGLIGIAVFASNIIRLAIHEAICLEGCNILPIEFVYAYGLIFTLLLAVLYYPSFELYRLISNQIIKQTVEKEEQPTKMEEMGLIGSSTQNLTNLLKLSTPFIAGIMSELLKYL